MFYIVAHPYDDTPKVYPFQDKEQFLLELGRMLNQFRVRAQTRIGVKQFDFLFAFEGRRLLFPTEPRAIFPVSLDESIPDSDPGDTSLLPTDTADAIPSAYQPAWDGRIAVSIQDAPVPTITVDPMTE